jgi:hypothetical protein
MVFYGDGGMTMPTLRQWQGFVLLAQKAAAEGVMGIETAQRTYARYPYAILRQVPPIAPVVNLVETIQGSITDIVYQSIHLGNHVGLSLASQALEVADALSAGPDHADPLR